MAGHCKICFHINGYPHIFFEACSLDPHHLCLALGSLLLIYLQDHVLGSFSGQKNICGFKQSHKLIESTVIHNGKRLRVFYHHIYKSLSSFFQSTMTSKNNAISKWLKQTKNIIPKYISMKQAHGTSSQHISCYCHCLPWFVLTCFSAAPCLAVKGLIMEEILPWHFSSGEHTKDQTCTISQLQINSFQYTVHGIETPQL